MRRRRRRRGGEWSRSGSEWVCMNVCVWLCVCMCGCGVRWGATCAEMQESMGDGMEGGSDGGVDGCVDDGWLDGWGGVEGWMARGSLGRAADTRGRNKEGGHFWRQQVGKRGARAEISTDAGGGGAHVRPPHLASHPCSPLTTPSIYGVPTQYIIYIYVCVCVYSVPMFLCTYGVGRYVV